MKWLWRFLTGRRSPFLPRFRFDTVEHAQEDIVAYAKRIAPLVDIGDFWRAAETAERETPSDLVSDVHERIAWQVRRAVEIAALERMTK